MLYTIILKSSKVFWLFEENKKFQINIVYVIIYLYENICKIFLNSFIKQIVMEVNK